MESVTALIDVHHAWVFAFCDGSAARGAPSSEKSPLRFRSMNSRVRSFGWLESAVTRIGIHPFASGPTLIIPVFAGRIDPAGRDADSPIGVSATCVPLGLKFGLGWPAEGAW